MAEDRGEKSHDPTPHRRDEARKKGQVAKSQELVSSIMLFFGIILLMTYGKKILALFRIVGERMLRETVFLIPGEMDSDSLSANVMHELNMLVYGFLGHLSVFFLALVALAVGLNLAQVGFLWLPDKLGFDFTRLDPIKGFGRMFSMQSVMKLLIGMVKITVCAIVAYYAVRNDIGTILNLTGNDEEQIAAFLLWTLMMIALKVAAALVVISIIDYMYQKWKHEQDLRMTTQEIRDEMKNMMGDPKLVGKRRQMHRDMASQPRNGSVLGTSDADVVVTNPTHYAVALKFDPETMEVPKVVAKGSGFLAKQIRKIALENGIPIIEKKALAQALFRTVEIGQSVMDTEHLIALAEILAYAYRLSGRNIEKELRKIKPHAA